MSAPNQPRHSAVTKILWQFKHHGEELTMFLLLWKQKLIAMLTTARNGALY
jgi:hypothetical protein